MPSFVARFAVIASLALALAASASGARSEPVTPTPPDAVPEAVAASSAPSGPAKVVVGAYINDIQELDFRSNSYAVDLYVWFRLEARTDLDPAKTMEFMNRYASDANIRDALYDAPKPMPDGSVYAIIRYQGQFSTKFRLEKYPFDTQALLVVMEDTVAAADAQVYVPDENGAVTINPDITLPGFKVGKPELHVIERAYPTNFGDLAEPEATDYSRLMLTIPVTRPIVAMSIKTFVPIGLIVVCAGARVLRAAALRRRPHRAWHHRASDPRRFAIDLERIAARRRLPDDDRQGLSPRLPVHHPCFRARGDDLVARRRALSPRRRFRATTASGSACCLVPISCKHCRCLAGA